jgi:hypothetical protein
MTVMTVTMRLIPMRHRRRRTTEAGASTPERRSSESREPVHGLARLKE